MRSIHVVSGAGVSAIVSALLIGCGGYGGSGMSYNMNGPMPTVTITAPAQASSINFGQAVQLSWNSSDATSCTATTSSSMGGAFTGAQATSGTATVAPTGSGSVTYTLSCSGAGGTASATSAMVTVNPSILSTLSPAGITTIGPTPDPVEQGGNPYGLAIAPKTSGLITAGDLIVCNFNDGATGTQGLGTTIVGLHPTAGATPYSIANSPLLQGCNALTLLPDDTISAAAYSANQNPLVAPDGTVNTPFSSDNFANPWGEAYAPASEHPGPAALYISNADGTIDRITLSGDSQNTFTRIASGFCASGTPGAIYAPAGLTYDASIDTLYIVDTSSYSVVAFANVSSLGADGIVVDGQCGATAGPPTPAPTFTVAAASAASARVIASGAPLIAPLSAALLSDGNLIVANSDINIGAGQTPNLVVEVSPVLPGGFVGQPVQLDASGTPGALFGIVATVDGAGNQLIYFNDDNTNSVMLLSK
jgi:hypothetical protein